MGRDVAFEHVGLNGERLALDGNVFDASNKSAGRSKTIQPVRTRMASNEKAMVRVR